MARYIIKRLLVSLLTIWVLTTLTFFLVKLIPGDPFSSDKIQPQILENMKKYYGLDKPVVEQYVVYLGNIVKGNFGISLKNRTRTVTEIISTAFPFSADLGIRALIFGAIMGIFLGIIAGINRGKFWDQFTILLAVIGVAVPGFIVGTLIQYLFAVKLHWLPVAQWKGFTYTLMPAFALSLGTLANLARYMRTSMLEVVSTDYIKTAKAKGLSPVQVTWKHQIRNAMLPIVTILGPVAAALLTGTFVIEQIFAIPGLGKYYVISFQNLDYPIILGTTIFFGIFLVAVNFLTDIIYGLVDPRIRIAK